MADNEELSHLIGEIYDAALDPAKWPSALAKSALFVGGQAAGLLSKNSVSQQGSAHYHVGVDANYITLYEEKYWKFDPLVPLFFFDVGEVTSRLDYVSDAEFFEGRFHREWAKPQGWVDSASVILEKSAANFAILSFLRSEAQGMVDDEMRRRVRLIFPHVQRAVLIGKTIDLKTAEATGLANALDGLSAGMFLVDEQARIVHANAAGMAMLARGDVVSAMGGRLVASAAETNQILRETFLAARGGDDRMGDKGVALPVSAGDGELYVAHVLPLTAGARRDAGTRYDAVAALFVHPAALQIPSPPEMIATAFSLTPAELRVLLALVEVDGVAAIAEVLGVTENTVHTHLRRLFVKTGTHGQVELVKLLAGFSNSLIG